MSSVRADSDWRDGFLFVGNQLALDFLNTHPVIDGQPTDLLPDFEALLRWFVAADLLSAREAGRLRQDWEEAEQAAAALESARELRQRLRKEVGRWEEGGVVRAAMLEELNRLMAEHPMRMRVEACNGNIRSKWIFVPRDPQDLLGPIAYWAATLFASIDHTRVRRCEGCVLHFYDSSKKGNRQWCSMRMCGNRAKVAAYQARQRQRG